MGRPINKKFFGNLNLPSYGSEQLGSGVGGEGVASVTISNSGTNYSAGTSVTFSAPQIKGGVRATGTPSIPTSGTHKGKIMDITVSVAGSGYTSGTLSVTTATAVSKASTGTDGATRIYPANTTGIYAGMLVQGTGVGTSSYVTTVGAGYVDVNATNAGTVSGTVKFLDNGAGFADTVVLTSNNVATARQNAISFTSYLTTGSSAVTGGDIIKQEAAKRYLVQNSQGIGQCKLKASDTLTAGTMNVIATDGSGATYWVNKLTAHKAYLTQRTGTSTYLVTDLVAGWTLGAATGTNQVTIANV